MVPVSMMTNAEVAEGLHAEIAKVVSWAAEIGLKGCFPEVRFCGEALSPGRAPRAGQRIAGGYVKAYFGFNSDAKARHQIHLFDRYYQAGLICDACCASAPHTKICPLFKYKVFFAWGFLAFNRGDARPICQNLPETTSVAGHARV